MRDNVVLIGMMGCGKSTVGKLLAEALDFAFVDTDQYIEEALGRTIPDIFAKEGEAFFRDQELGALQSRWSARELVGQLALMAGLIPEYAPISPGELIPLFSWEKLPQADCTAPLL